MSITQDIKTYLRGYEGLTNLVGQRIYPKKWPQGCTFPAVTFERISLRRHYSHSGYSGLNSPRFQFSSWAERYSDAEQVAEQLIAALEAWPATKTVQAAFVDNALDIRDSETGLYHMPVDVILWHA